MHQIYAAMQAEHPLSLWMSDYIPRLEGLHRASLAKRADGSWQLRGFAALRTVRLDPALGWPDLARSTGVAGVRDLPQGRYVHLSAANARLVLRDSRDPRPALEEANLPLKHWRYRDDGRVEFAFAGHLPLRLVVRAAGDCRLSAAGKAFPERPATACGRSSCRWSRCAMANSSAADKHPQARLLNPWALLPVALGVALVLWLTFNSEEVFMPSGDGEPDAVSVNYAELLLQAHPENDALRLTLIDLLVKLGDFEQARHHLARLRGKDRLATPFYEVELDILGALARPEGMDEEQTRRLLERLRKIEHVSLNDAMLERLARHALALDAPDLAARTFAELAGRDPQGRQRWLDEAARWYLASGEPLPAADIQRQLAEAQTEPAKRLAYLRQAFASLLAGERGEQAALLLDERLDALPEDESTLAWLAEGVRAAEGSQRYDLAERFIRRWRELRPGTMRRWPPTCA